MGASIGKWKVPKKRLSGALSPRPIAGLPVRRPWDPKHFDPDFYRRSAALAALVFAATYGTVALTRFHGPIASVWLTTAVIVGMVMNAPRAGRTALLSIAFIAHIVASLAIGDSLALAALLAGITILESLIVIIPMKRAFDSQGRFDCGYVLARFLLFAGVISPLCGSLLGAGGLLLIGDYSFTTMFVHWFLADALGLLSLGALILAAQARGETTSPETRRAGVIGVLLSSGVTVLAFTHDSKAGLFAVAPVLMIAALRAPLTGTMAALVSCASLGIGLTYSGVGPLAQAHIDPATRTYLLQAFIASLLFVVLPVRALIGERDRLGVVIAQSERLFARIAEASPAGTIHFDPHGRLTFVNQRWTDLTGIDRDAVDQDRWLDAIDPADQGAAKSLWSHARATLEPCGAEYRYRAGGTATGFADLNFYPEVDDGLVLGFVARLTDVTERRRAEDAVHEREEHYRLVTENAHDVVLRLGLDGCPHFVSAASLRVTGFAPAELVGYPLSDRIHPDDLPVFAHTLERLAAGEAEGAIELRLRHRDGHYRWFESTQRPVFGADGAPTELVASLRDIDQRRRSERRARLAAAKLHETNRLMLLAEELAGVGSWQLGTRRSALVLAPQINRMLGRKRSDRFQVGEILAVVHHADRRALLACMARARRHSRSTECALRIIAPDGLRHVRLVAQADLEHGSFIGWVGVAHDVTDKVASEAALIAARDEAQAAAAAKSHFLATMSHEIRTPMTGVLGMIELSRDDPTPIERGRYFAALAQSAAMLMSVVDDVLDFSKIDSGKLRLEESDFDIESLTLATIDLFGTAALHKRLSVDFVSSCPPSTMVRGDAVRLQQILSNLLSNAIKFTERGQISVTLAYNPKDDGERYQVAVADTGIGLEADQIDHLFDPFVQTDLSISRRYGGTGLGLAISRRLVEAMGGKLDVAARPGHGSTFTFDVRLGKGPALDAFACDSTVGTVRVRPLDVLVAEDNAISQLLIATLVRQWAIRSRSLPTAWRRSRRRRPVASTSY